MKLTALFVILISLFIAVPQVFARTTPADIFNSEQQAYQQTVSHYSTAHQQALKNLSDQIAMVNKSRTDQLNQIVETQAAILDEYNRRHPGQNATTSTTDHESPLYWLTYAHEAVAYQAGKIYIFDLTSESNIERDATSTVNIFQSDLESVRAKVVKSQGIIGSLVKNE